MPWTRVEIDECEKRLASIAASLEQRESVTLPEAYELMRNASDRWLLDFDARSRSRSFWGDGIGSKHRLTDWGLSQPDSARTEVLLFVQGCTSSGYVRERALQSPRWPGGRLTWAAVLIRLEDWVPQVAAAARKQFEKLAATDSVRHLFGLIDLVGALCVRSRFAAHWRTLIEPLMIAPQWRAERQAAMSARDSFARRLAYELSLKADADETPAILRRALADPAIRNALWAMEQLPARANSDTQLEMLRVALDHRLGAVRAGALRQLANWGIDDLRPLLIDRLLDQAHSVRSVAAYELQARFGESPLNWWRAAFDAGRKREILTGVLAEFGGIEDHERLRSQLAHRKSKVRAAALLGLCRSEAPEREDLVRRALHDGASRVVAAAVEGFKLCNLDVSATELAQALSNAKAARIRARLIAASRLLPKWDRLEHVLWLYGRCPPEEWHHLEVQLRTWEGRFNQSYVNLDAARRQALLDKIATVSRLHPQLSIARLTTLVR